MSLPPASCLRIWAGCLFLFIWSSVGSTDDRRLTPPDMLSLGPFSAAVAGGAFPDGWAPLTFNKIKRHSRYELVADTGTVVVKATSAAAASGMMIKARIDPRLYPVIRWRWKVDNIYRKGDVTRKDGDDYPARLYVTFHYDPAVAGFLDRATFETARLVTGEYPPMGAISYIWASNAPSGGVFPNPYTDKVKMIVVRSGGDQAGQWLSESRNLVDDYRRVFGADPPDVSGVAIMTDSDNTGESATAYYGDIEFNAK
ncbi:MAG: DUF3047 domain-containing protein [Pseudomonadota bacterium]